MIRIKKFAVVFFCVWFGLAALIAAGYAVAAAFMFVVVHYGGQGALVAGVTLCAAIVALADALPLPGYPPLPPPMPAPTHEDHT